jgi:hydroxymethylpyrimidine/phosphomethylpyrimidine kinase
MPSLMTDTPVVMSITSNDATGGGGMSADIETLCSLGCHCTPIITSLSAPGIFTSKYSQVANTGLLIEQIRAVLEDIKVNLINIGHTASITNIEAIHTILNDYPTIPVVFHPNLTDQPELQDMVEAAAALLLPRTDMLILTKNEAEALSPAADTLSACARGIMELGCNNILITDSTEKGKYYTNHWYSHRSVSRQYQWQRLPYNYHGAMSTLSSAVSAYLAHGLSLAESLQQAQKFCWQALQNGRRIGMGDLVPNRMHWCQR